jgi:hypothetical protein
VNFANVPGAGTPYGSVLTPDAFGQVVTVVDVQLSKLAASVDAVFGDLRAILLRDEDFGPLSFRTGWAPRVAMLHVNTAALVYFRYVGAYTGDAVFPDDPLRTSFGEDYLPLAQGGPRSAVFDFTFAVGAATDGTSELGPSLNFGQVYPTTPAGDPAGAATQVGLAQRYYGELITRSTQSTKLTLRLLTKAGLDLRELSRFNRLYIFDGQLLRLRVLDKVSVGSGYTAEGEFDLL